MIIDAAEKLGIDPANALSASISNLRTIIKPAKDAISVDAIDDIRKLFELAGDLNNRELRDRLGGNEREIVIYRRVKTQENITYEISLSEDQFNTIQASTKYKITFEEQ